MTPTPPNAIEPHPANTTVGRNIRQLRENREWSQTDLVIAIREHGHRWTQTTLSLIETGTRHIRATELDALGYVFSVDMNALFGMEPRNQPEHDNQIAHVARGLHDRDGCGSAQCQGPGRLYYREAAALLDPRGYTAASLDPEIGKIGNRIARSHGWTPVMGEQ